MQEKILEICKELCGKKISVDEELIQTGLLDSFKIMELVCSLEEEYQVVFQPEEIMDLDNFSCVGHMLEIVRKKNM